MKVTTTLSLAVSLKDDYTARQPIGSINVFLAGKDLKSLKNPSGYYLFLDLPGDRYQVRVESEHYFKEGAAVKLQDIDPLNPVVQFQLKPKPSYPFPPGTTLLRGMVRDIEKNAVPGAVVEIKGKNLSNITNDKGEFVLYFKGLTEQDIIKEGSKRFVKGIDKKKISLEINYNSDTLSVNLEELEEGKTTILEIPGYFKLNKVKEKEMKIKKEV